jgi:hypothetical protein
VSSLPRQRNILVRKKEKKRAEEKFLMNLERVLSAKRWASAAKAESFPGPTRCRLTVRTAQDATSGVRSSGEVRGEVSLGGVQPGRGTV